MQIKNPIEAMPNVRQCFIRKTNRFGKGNPMF
jgi:hypothetical protein